VLVPLAVVGLVAAAAGLSGGGPLVLPRAAPDASVDLDEDDAARGTPMDDGDRAAALAPFDPNRPRCEPRGCERWRVELDGLQQVVPFGDVVVASTNHGLVAIAADDGSEVWRVPTSVVPGPGPGELAVERLAVSDSGTHLAVASADGGGLQVVAPDGVVRWSANHHGVAPAATDTTGATEATGSLAELVFLGDEVLFVAHRIESDTSDEVGADGEPPRRVVTRDTATGEILWQQPKVDRMSPTGDGVLLQIGDTIRFVDAASGRLRARAEAPATSFVSGQDGVFTERTEDGRYHLRAPTTLERVTRREGLADVVVFGAEETGGEPVALGLLRGQRDTSRAVPAARGNDRLLLLAADGTVRWTLEQDFVAFCCPYVRMQDGALVLLARAGTAVARCAGHSRRATCCPTRSRPRTRSRPTRNRCGGRTRTRPSVVTRPV